MGTNQSIKKAKLRNFICASFALWTAFGSACLVSAAERPLTPEQIAYFQSGNEDARFRVLVEMAHTDHVEAAQTLLFKFPLQGPLAKNRTLFLEGLIFEKHGRLNEAAAKFRAALANDPHLTLVRVELAKTLADLDETDSAKHHLQLLEAETQDPQQLAGIRSFIDSLDARHPFTFSGFVSIAPSTNINQGSSNSTVYSPGIAGLDGVGAVGTIAPSSQAMSGLGITSGINIGFDKRIGDDWQAVLAAGLTGTYYPALNSVSLGASQSAEMRYLIKDGYLGFGGVASENADPVNLMLGYTSYGPRLSMAKLLTPRDQLTANATYEWRDYYSSPMTNGNALTVNAILTHAMDSTSNIALLGGYENVTQQIAFNSYQDVSVGLGVYKELPHGVTAQLQGTARFAGFDDVNPFTLSTRQDQNLTGSITLTKRDWNLYGFAPSLNYTYTRNFSNISVYDFDSHSVDFRLTKNF